MSGLPEAGDKVNLHARLEPVPEDEAHPCRFCSSPVHAGAIAERGYVSADFRLTDAYDRTLGYACQVCLDGVEVVD